LFGALIECVGTSVARGQTAELVPAAPAPLAMTPAPLGVTSAALDTTTTTHRRPRAIEYSDWYARRLMVHKIGSYVELPLFAGEWYLGNKLLNGDGTDTEKNLHGVVAGGLGVLFGVNTLTGGWNLYDSWGDPSDRKRKIIHSVLMLASDAGFALTGAVAGDARENASRRSLHQNLAIGSMGLSTVGTLMMWLWKD
ncbi:MAG: hypothetical protein ACRD3J_20315, partial [Thermoanaerobaculia bacterium]